MDEPIRVQNIKRKVEGRNYELLAPLPTGERFVCICGTVGFEGLQLKDTASGSIILVSKRCAEAYCGIKVKGRKGRRVKLTDQFKQSWSVRDGEARR